MLNKLKTSLRQIIRNVIGTSIGTSIGQIDPLRAKIIVAWIDEATNWQTEFFCLYRDLLVHSAPRVLTLAAAAFEIETDS